MGVAFIFPGQGSQYVGMGADVAATSSAARAILAEADEVLGYRLSRLCAEGPADELALTVHAQPAILATSIALLRALEAGTDLRPLAVAGHSLGEYTALVAAESLAFADALRVVHERGRLMQEAVPVGVGAMAAVVGLDEDAVASLCAGATHPGEVLEAATVNGGGQIVIAGHTTAVDRALAQARDRGARLAQRLPVSAPFHCSLMSPAARGLAAVLREVRFRTPRVPVVCNVDGAATIDAELLRRRLVEQMERPVRWDRCMQTLAALGCTRALEIGPGKVLAGLARRMAVGVRCRSVGTLAALREVGEGDVG
jgi:[acyl-carrier-protein] S-malonyltransferase